MKATTLTSFFFPFILSGGVLPPIEAAIYENDYLEQVGGQLTTASEKPTPLPRPNSGHGTFEGDWAPSSGPFDPLESLREALEVMQSTWFQVWVGTWPTAIDWTRAVTNTHLVAATGSLSKALDTPTGLWHASWETIADAEEIENEINQYFSQNVSVRRSL